jgi:hypothetical protein
MVNSFQLFRAGTTKANSISAHQTLMAVKVIGCFVWLVFCKGVFSFYVPSKQQVAILDCVCPYVDLAAAFVWRLTIDFDTGTSLPVL